MQAWLSALLIIANIALFPASHRQSSIQFNDVGAFFTFGEEVTFQVSVDPPEQIEQIYLSIQPQGQSTRLEPVELNENGEGIFTFNTRQLSLRPFARTFYWYRAVLVGGSEVESVKYWFDYIDNRFTWRTVQEDGILVNWHEGDLVFAQTALNVARAGYEKARDYIPVDLPNKVEIYIYEQSTNLQEALQLTQQSWVAGHASPDLAIVLVSIPPGADQRLEMERQIPHELAHLMQYQATGEQYDNLPIWLVEGSASLAEIYPNPDYQRVLDDAVQKNALLPFNSVCVTFPRDASGAFLAYAQSASFVRYIQQEYGSTALLKLFDAYKDGLGCEEAPEQALGVRLTQLELQWRRSTLNMDMGELAMENLSPYLFLLLVILASPFATILLSKRK